MLLNFTVTLNFYAKRIVQCKTVADYVCRYFLQCFCYQKLSFNFIFGLNLISFYYVLGVVILYLCDNDLKVKEIYLSKGKKRTKAYIHVC